jgi:hypothetical protein
MHKLEAEIKSPALSIPSNCGVKILPMGPG